VVYIKFLKYFYKNNNYNGNKNRESKRVGIEGEGGRLNMKVQKVLEDLY
jgi:hypothetical protein